MYITYIASHDLTPRNIALHGAILKQIKEIEAAMNADLLSAQEHGVDTPALDVADTIHNQDSNLCFLGHVDKHGQLQVLPDTGAGANTVGMEWAMIATELARRRGVPVKWERTPLQAHRGVGTSEPEWLLAPPPSPSEPR